MITPQRKREIHRFIMLQWAEASDEERDKLKAEMKEMFGIHAGVKHYATHKYVYIHGKPVISHLITYSGETDRFTVKPVA